MFYVKFSLRYSYFCPEFLVTQKRLRLIRRLKLIPKSMASLTGQQIITIHLLTNISRSKSNQAMKFGQLIEHKVRNIFLQKPCKKWARENSLDLFLFVDIKQVFNTLVLIYFGRPPLGHTTDRNFITFHIVDLEKCSILIFYKKVWD